jgi:hypothetical protein
VRPSTAISVFQQARRAASMAPETGIFPPELLDTYPFASYLVIAICCALQAAYPAGDGSVAILCSIPPNSRRVRWLSANSNQ